MNWSSWYALGGAALLLCFWAVGAHNRVMALRGAIHGAWPALDGLLADRAQALAALCAALRPHRPDDAAVLDAALAAASQVRVCAEQVRPRPSRADAVAGLAAAEAALAPAQARLLALLAPEDALRTQDDVAAPLQALATLDARLPFARDAFNQAAQRYNAAVRQFPTQLLAPVLRFQRAGVL